MDTLTAIVVALEADPTAHTIGELAEAAVSAGVPLPTGLKAEKVAAARKAIDAAITAAADEADAAASAAEAVADADAAAADAATEAAAKAAAEASAAEAATEAAAKAAADDAARAAAPLTPPADDPEMLTALLTMIGVYGHPADSVMTREDLCFGVRSAWRTFAPLLQDILQAGAVPPLPHAQPPPPVAPPVMALPATALDPEGNVVAVPVLTPAPAPVLTPAKAGGELVELPQPPKTGVFAVHGAPPAPVLAPAGVFATDIPVLTPDSPTPVLGHGDKRARTVLTDALPMLVPDGA